MNLPTDSAEYEGVTIARGQYLRFVRNPYPLKGMGNSSAPWDPGKVYRVIDVNPGSGRFQPIVTFAVVSTEPTERLEWEVNLDTVALGFEVVELMPAGRA
jgi:hypothetical protein